MCKGLCSLIFKIPHFEKYHKYSRCTVCEVWFEKPAVRCACCKSVLRSKPRRSRNRKKYIDPSHKTSNASNNNFVFSPTKRQ